MSGNVVAPRASSSRAKSKAGTTACKGKSNTANQPGSKYAFSTPAKVAETMYSGLKGVVIRQAMHPDALFTDQAKLSVMLAEIPYCMERTYEVMERIVAKNDKASMFTYASCIVYLTGFCARMAHENPHWFDQDLSSSTTVGNAIVEAVTRSANFWRKNVTLRPAIDIAEGSKGIDTIPGIHVGEDMLHNVLTCPDLPEWADREANAKKPNRWGGLTLVVTLQWCISRNPTAIMRYMVAEVLNCMPRAITMVDVKKQPKKKAGASSRNKTVLVPISNAQAVDLFSSSSSSSSPSSSTSSSSSTLTEACQLAVTSAATSAAVSTSTSTSTSTSSASSTAAEIVGDKSNTAKPPVASKGTARTRSGPLLNMLLFTNHGKTNSMDAAFPSTTSTTALSTLSPLLSSSTPSMQSPWMPVATVFPSFPADMLAKAASLLPPSRTKNTPTLTSVPSLITSSTSTSTATSATATALPTAASPRSSSKSVKASAGRSSRTSKSQKRVEDDSDDSDCEILNADEASEVGRGDNASSSSSTSAATSTSPSRSRPASQSALEKYYTVSSNASERIYCVTHVILVLSEFGTRPILQAHCSHEELEQLAEMLADWLMFIAKDYPAAHSYNRELVTEICASLVICKHNGVQLAPAVLAAIKVTAELLIDAALARGSLPAYRHADAAAKQNVYLEVVPCTQSRTEKGAMFANYHLHYLVGMFFQLLVIDTYGGCGNVNYPESMLKLPKTAITSARVPSSTSATSLTSSTSTSSASSVAVAASASSSGAKGRSSSRALFRSDSIDDETNTIQLKATSSFTLAQLENDRAIPASKRVLSLEPHVPTVASSLSSSTSTSTSSIAAYTSQASALDEQSKGTVATTASPTVIKRTPDAPLPQPRPMEPGRWSMNNPELMLIRLRHWSQTAPSMKQTTLQLQRLSASSKVPVESEAVGADEKVGARGKKSAGRGKGKERDVVIEAVIVDKEDVDSSNLGPSSASSVLSSSTSTSRRYALSGTDKSTKQGKGGSEKGAAAAAAAASLNDDADDVISLNSVDEEEEGPSSSLDGAWRCPDEVYQQHRQAVVKLTRGRKSASSASTSTASSASTKSSGRSVVLVQ